MAFVGISQKLLSDVKSHIARMQEKEASTHKPPDIKTILVDSDDFDRLVWGEHIKWKGVLPWMHKAKSAHVATDHPKLGKITIKFPFSKPAKVPPAVSYYSDYLDVDLPSSDPLLAEVISYKLKLHEVDERWEKVARQILGFLEKCKSLNEALKLWPQIDMYIPKEYMDKVQKKVEKKSTDSEAKDALKSLDTEQLTAAAVIARLSGK